MKCSVYQCNQTKTNKMKMRYGRVKKENQNNRIAIKILHPKTNSIECLARISEFIQQFFPRLYDEDGNLLFPFLLSSGQKTLSFFPLSELREFVLR